MNYVPLTDASPFGGLATVVFASLEDAGFQPVADGDLRGWMHFRGWPLGALMPVTIWVPDDLHEAACAFLATPPETPAAREADSDAGRGFWVNVYRLRPWYYALWLALLLSGLVAL